MSLFEKFKELVYEKRKITEPIFLKDFNSNNYQLRYLENLFAELRSGYIKEQVKRDIIFFKQGIAGEKYVYNELKKSCLPILCLYDIRIEHEEYVAQFDFILISPKNIYVLETKTLNGDITITPEGNFIKLVKSASGKVDNRETIYSPIVQNERSANLLGDYLQKNNISRLPVMSLVVIASPNSKINFDNCPIKISDKICRFDKLNIILKETLEDKHYDNFIPEKNMYKIAHFIQDNHKSTQAMDFIKKYRLTNEDYVSNPDLHINIYEELRKYRHTVSREENIKTFMVFSNQTLEALAEKRPRTREELLQIKGLGEKKVDKYGDEILLIINS